jgi:hypothetical protein
VIAVKALNPMIRVAKPLPVRLTLCTMNVETHVTSASMHQRGPEGLSPLLAGPGASVPCFVFIPRSLACLSSELCSVGPQILRELPMITLWVACKVSGDQQHPKLQEVLHLDDPVDGLDARPSALSLSFNGHSAHPVLAFRAKWNEEEQLYARS